VTKQAAFALIGLIALFVLMRVDYRRYNNPKLIFTLMGVTGLLLIAVFAMSGMNGAHRWIRIAGTTLQPSELAKPVIVLFLAWWLQTRIHKIDDIKETISAGGDSAAAVHRADFEGAGPGHGDGVRGGADADAVPGGHADEVDRGGGCGCAAPVMYWMLFHVAWRAARMKVFLNPEADPKGAGFHILQSLIAVGSGGIGGRGLMEGVQKLFFLPEPHTDFIFANICEELGLIGALCVVAAFCVLGYRGLRAAFLSRDPFARFLAFGLTTAILVQAFFNMSVVLALLPTKGIPLPFISSGGTSVFITLACMGVLLNVTRESRLEQVSVADSE
jgi:cell division protein FtsW